MTNTYTADVDATAAQVRALHQAGSELVRVTVNNEAAADAVPAIVAQVDVPVIGDFHYNGHLLLTKYPRCAAALAKYRINPANDGAKRREGRRHLDPDGGGDRGHGPGVAHAAAGRRSHRGSAGRAAGAPVARPAELHAAGLRLPGLRAHDVVVLSGDGRGDPDPPAGADARVAGALPRRR